MKQQDLYTQIRTRIVRIFKQNPAIYAAALRWKWSRKGPKEMDLTFLARFRYRLVVDIGANVGEYAYFLAPKSEKVWSFEPNPLCQSVLRKHGIPNVVVERFALGDFNGTATLSVPVSERGELFSFGTLANPLAVQESTGSEVAPTLREYQVEVRRFDDTEHLRSAEIDLVKIDVEGAELSVLSGMDTFLKEANAVLLVEIEARRTPDWISVFSFLTSRGYDAYATFDGESLYQVDQNHVIEQNPPPGQRDRYIFNYYFFKASSVEVNPALKQIAVNIRSVEG